MILLVPPNISHKQEWEEIISEWDESRRRPRIFFQDSFETFLEKSLQLSQADDEENEIPRTNFFFLQDDMQEKILGFFCIRHHLNFRGDDQYTGNIGYGIRPSEREKGYAKKGLALCLQEAKRRGFEKVLMVCDDTNSISKKVIYANKGVLDSFSYKEGVKRGRYWIDLYFEENLLVSLEKELLSSSVRHNPARLDELLAPDFFECGKNGDRFGKARCLISLPQEPEKKKFAVGEMDVHMLSETLSQVRYTCTIENPGESPTTSFRTSLWRKTESGWQMFFHQGTLLKSHN